MYTSVLDGEGLKVLHRLGESTLAKEYYLAGGTALALQIGHRRSYDLDFFLLSSNAERIDGAEISDHIRKIFGMQQSMETLRQIDQSQWTIHGTKVTFLAYPFPLQYDPVRFGNIRLADPREISLMKAYALGRRATIRDYVDLFFLLKERIIDLDEIIRHANRKFVIAGERVFSTRLFLSRLVYTADLEERNAPVNLMEDRLLDFSQVESYLKQRVKEYVDRTLTGAEEESP